MRKINTFIYHLGQGFKGVFRNRVMSIASLLVLITCMLFLGTFYLLIENIDRGFKSIDDINIMEIFLSESLSQDEVENIFSRLDEIKRTKGSIVNYEFRTKAENFRIFLERETENSIIREIFTEENNPLPRSVRVEFISFNDSDFNIEKVYSLKSEIEAIEGINNGDIKENIEFYEKVSDIKSTVTIAGVWIILICIVFSLVVIMNTIKLGLYARRHEIIFMRYVGATKYFIRMPFNIEGIIIGLLSAGAAFGLQYYIYENILIDIVKINTDAVTGSFFAPFSEYSKFIFISFLFVGLIIGIFASRLSIKKYLKA